jgi:IS5 family transposase
MHDLSDEALCLRWLENPYYQFFCGEVSFCHKLPVGGAQDRGIDDP